jgi:SAM-dependent methyltransferase
MKQSISALQQQYRDSSNFRKRAALVGKFSTNRYPWYRWVYDQLELSPDALVLELGCGPGSLWKRNLDRILPGSTIVMSDFSAGMLRDSQNNLGASRSSFSFCQLDGAALPFRPQCLDAVIANMMFYHVHDRPAALRDMRPAGFCKFRVIRHRLNVSGSKTGSNSSGRSSLKLRQGATRTNCV